MSYIRPLSNPESLYIWGNRHGQVEISYGQDYDNQVMPRHVFEGLMRKWVESYFTDSVKYRGASLVEDPEHDWKWRLDYKGWSKPIHAFQVTWFYVASFIKKNRR